MKRKLFQESPPQQNNSDSSKSDSAAEGNGEVKKEDVVGEDIDTLEMKIEDCVQQLSCDNYGYTTKYLLDCRKKLMSKVDDYRTRLEESYSENAELVYKHRKELETIRAFYQSICHLPTRAGRILKASQGKLSAARQVLEEVGLDYIYDGSKYIVR